MPSLDRGLRQEAALRRRRSQHHPSSRRGPRPPGTVRPPVPRTTRETPSPRHSRIHRIIQPHRGATAAPGRVADLVIPWTEPRDRSEQEIAGYRAALQLIHESHADIPFSVNLVLQLHQMLYRYLPGTGGRWKSTDNEIVERDADGKVIR